MKKVIQLEVSPAGAGRRERQRLETRNRLYEAALEEFRRAGFAAAQIDRIAERAGVSRGTFYFHFPSKEHVLFELQRRHEGRIVERIGAAVRERGDSILDFLHGVVAAIAGQVEDVEDPALGREIMAMYVRNPVVVNVSSMPLISAVADGFAEAAERGEVRDDVPPEELALTFLSALFGCFVGNVETMQQDLSDFDRIIEIFSRGIRP